MNQRKLYEKIILLKKNKELGFSEEEIKFLSNKVKNHKLGLQLNYTEIDEGIDNNYYVFKENKELGINVKHNEKNNLLIEGDNYHALRALQVAGVKVDVIYIDPPYNTGKEFIYNDEFKTGVPQVVGDDDDHKHSKWLSFMKKRLILARELLTDDGIIFISIDDNEQAYLKVILDEIFGETNNLASIIIQKKSGGGQAASYYKGHDNLFVYAKNKKNRREIFIPHENPQFKEITINGMEYAYYPDSIRKMHGKFEKSKLKDGEIRHRNVFFEDYKITFSEKKQKEIEKKMDKLEIIKIFFKPENAYLLCKAEPLEKAEPKKLIYSIITSWTSSGQKTFNNIFPERKPKTSFWFEAPKPVDLLKTLLKYNLNSVVLDFFAGSGTTGEAVMELNKEDGGNRRFILITNNEMHHEKQDKDLLIKYGNDVYKKEDKKAIYTAKYPELGICRIITRERIFRVINGKGSKNENIKWEYSKNIKSLNENSLRYLELEEVHKVDGEFEQIDSKKKLYKLEFNKNLSIEDFE